MGKIKFVKVIDDHTSLIHTSYKSPIYGVACRDMVTLTTHTVLTPSQAAEHGFGENCEVFVQASVDRRDDVPAQKGYVRGSVHCFGLILISRAGSTHLDIHLVMSIDPCGWIPTKAVDGANAEQMNKTSYMMQHIMALQAQVAQIPKAVSVSTAAVLATPPRPLRVPAAPLPPTFLEVFKLYRSKDWSLKCEKNGVKFFEKPSPYCGKKACLFTSSLGARLSTAMEFLVEPHDRLEKDMHGFK